VPQESSWVFPANERCTADVSAARPRDRDRQSLCARTKAFHSCEPGRCAPGDSGPPEALGRCRVHLRHCDGDLGPRTHVYDLAGKAWLLPRIIELSRDRRASERLSLLLADMLQPRPDDRPSFNELLGLLTACAGRVDHQGACVFN